MSRILAVFLTLSLAACGMRGPLVMPPGPPPEPLFGNPKPAPAATPAAKAAARTEEADESDSDHPENVPQTSTAVPTTDGAQPNLFS